MVFTDAIALAARLMESAGVVVMLVGTVVALVLEFGGRRPWLTKEGGAAR